MVSLDELKDYKHRLSITLKLFFRWAKDYRHASIGYEQVEKSVGGSISLIRELLKSSGIYVLSSVASPLISLVLAPFLAHHLSRADYGALAVLIVTIALVAGVTQLGLGSAFFRLYSYDYESQEDRSCILSTAVILLLLTSVPITIALILAAPWLTPFLLGSHSMSDSVRLAALVILLQNLTIPAFAFLRAENRAAFYAMLSIASLLVTLGATIVLVGGMHLGISGSLIATGGGYALIVVCTLPPILLRVGVRLRSDIVWGLLAFGVPNVFNFLAMWVLQLSDRFLLARLASLAQTASYAVAYSLGGAISIVVMSPFLLAWPSFVFAISKRADAQHTFKLVFRWYCIVLLLATYTLSFVGTAVLDILFPPAYHSASPIIPIIAMSLMFFGVYNFVGFGVSLRLRRTMWLGALFTTISALVNVGFNLFLIPHYEAMGAAVSTLIAYIVLAVIGYIVCQRVYPVPFEIGRFIIALFVGMALYIGSNFLAQPQGTYAGWVISIGALALYSGFLILLGVFATWSRKSKSRTVQEDSSS